MAAINVSVGGNTRQLERDIQKTVNKAYNINLKTKGDQPLGRITGQVNEFEKSLAASNARVIAFGASAGIIFGIERAFGALAASAVEVQKSLQDINVILNVSSSQLNKFGADLFNIAKNTGQSFNEVAKAATEFSRQGLGVEETLKRTNQALILSRLSGLDAAKSVEALTAAVNSYASQAVTASEVVNKFANVDAAFAVSSADLADALARVGSSAAQSGVSLNELIAVVTAAQQTTARGGAVIGNSFKTIFTRLQRGKVVDLLENLGISTTDSSGQIKSTIQLLQDLAKTYDQLGTLQQAEVAEKVGGVFQINILKAALADLGKEYSIYNSALGVAASTTDQAIRRNEELNKTYAAQINVLKENAKQLAASAGQRVLGPTFERVVGGANQVLGGINEADGNDYGSVLGKGILDGLGQILAGPGLALLGGIFAKLFADLSKFAVGSAKDFLGLNNAAKQQAELQRSITDILSKNPALIQQMGQGTAGVNKLAETLLVTLKAQTLELQKQQQVAAQVASILAKSGVKVTGGVPIAPTSGKPGKAAGYIPNFAASAGVSKKDAFAETIGAYQAGYEPGTIRKKRLYDGQGGSFLATVNDAESFKTVVGPNDEKGTFVTPPNAAKGFVPNFAKKLPNIGEYIPFAKDLGLKVGQVTSTDYKLVRQAILKNGGNRSREEIEADIRQIASSRKGVKTTAGALRGSGKFGYIYAAQGGQEEINGKVLLTKNSNPVPYSFTSIGTKKPFTFEDDINERLTPIVKDLANKILPTKSKILNTDGLNFNEFIDKSSFSQIYGRLFEAVVNRALSKSVKKESGNQRFEFFASELGGPNGAKLQDIFNGSLTGLAAADLKFRSPKGSPESTISFIKKMAAVSGVPYDPSRGAVKLAAQGYVPNFAALQDAVNRERAAGVPAGKIYVARDKRLAATGYNPFGLGVFNTRDEPNSGARSQAIKSRGYSSGYIPNFVEEDTNPADLSASVAALVTQLGFVAFALSGFGNQYKQSLKELTDANKQAERVTKRSAQERRAIFDRELKAGRTKEEAIKTANYGPGRGAKFGAGITAGGAALAIGAPIIAQTIANAIGKETKEARVGSAAASALGDIGSFAGTGALVAGPKGAIVGGLIGALTGLTGVIKELNTNIPELSAKAKESASNLTQFNEASQRTKTAFEQIEELRNKGQVTEAGKAQQELLKNIGKDFANNPSLRSQAISSVINKDFRGLQNALDKNTEALIKVNQQEESNLSIGKFLKDVGAENVGRLEYDNKVSFDQQDLEKIKKAFEEQVLPFSAISDRRYETGLGPENENRQLLNEVETTLTLFREANLNEGTVSRESRTKFLNLVQPGLQQDQQESFLKMNDSEFLFKVLNQYADAVRAGQQEWKNIDQQTGRFNKEVQNVISNISDVKDKFDSFASSLDFTLNLQRELNNAISEAKSALESAKLSNISNAFNALGNTTQSRRFDFESQLTGFEQTKNAGIGGQVANVQDTLIKYLTEQASKQVSAITPTAQPGQDPLQSALKAQSEIRSAIEKLGKQISGINFSGEDGGQGVPEMIKNGITQGAKDIVAKIPNLSADQQVDATKRVEEALRNVYAETLKQTVALDKQTAILAEQKVGEIMQEFINASTAALGGKERFTSTNLTFLTPFKKAVADILTLGQGPQGEPIDIQKGRTSLNLLDAISKIIGRNIIPDLANEGDPIVGDIITNFGKDIANQLESVISSFQRLSGTPGNENYLRFIDTILNKLAQQTGTQEEFNRIKSTEGITAAIRFLSEKLAAAGIGASTPQDIGGVREAAINEFIKNQSQGLTPEQAEALKDTLTEGFKTSLTPEDLKSLELNNIKSVLDKILEKIPTEVKVNTQTGETIVSNNSKNQTSGDDSSGGSTSASGSASDSASGSRSGEEPKEKKPQQGAPPSRRKPKDKPKEDEQKEEKDKKTYAQGYLPSYAKELNSIRKGVGGARGSDYPLFVPNLNGNSAWINSGEKLIPNFANTGETAVLTREMQKAMNMAEGYIPDDAAVATFLSQFRQKKSTRLGDTNYKKVREWFRANENAVTQTSTVGGRTPENTLLTRGTGKGPGSLRGLQNFIQYGGGESGLFDNYAPNNRPLGYWSGDTSRSGRQFIAMNTDLMDRFSAQDFSTRRHEIVHGMQADTAGSKAGEMFKGKIGKFFGQVLGDDNKFGKWRSLVAETQARIIQERSTSGGILRMIQDSPWYAQSAANNAKKFISASLSENPEIYLKAANEQLGSSKIYSNISRYAGFLGDSDLINFAKYSSKKGSQLMRQIGAGNVSVNDIGRGVIDQFKNIPSLLQNPRMLAQLGGNIFKGGAVGMATQTAGEKFIPKADEDTYIGQVLNELRSFGIATGSGAAAGAAGTGGAGTILGAVSGAATDTFSKLWRLGSSTAELAKLTWDEWGRDEKLQQQQEELKKRVDAFNKNSKKELNNDMGLTKMGPSATGFLDTNSSGIVGGQLSNKLLKSTEGFRNKLKETSSELYKTIGEKIPENPADAIDKMLALPVSTIVDNDLKKSLELATELNSIFNKNLGLGFEKPGGLFGKDFNVKTTSNTGASAFVMGGPFIRPTVGFDKEYYGNSGTDLGTIVHEAAHLNQIDKGLFGKISSAMGGDFTPGQDAASYRDTLKNYADKLIAMGALNPESVDSGNIIEGFENYDLRYDKNQGPGSEFTAITKDSLGRTKGVSGKLASIKGEDALNYIYNMERQAYLNSILATAINEGMVSKQDLIDNNIAKDQKEADLILGIIGQITDLSPSNDSTSVTSGYKKSLPMIESAIKYANQSTQANQLVPTITYDKTVTDKPFEPIKETGPTNVVSTSKSYAKDPEVAAAIKTGNISAIEQATKNARDRANQEKQKSNTSSETIKSTKPINNTMRSAGYRPINRPTTPYILTGGNNMSPAKQTNLQTGTTTEVPRATPVFKTRPLKTEGFSSATSYAQDPGVIAARKTGNISAIEQATAAARARAGKTFTTSDQDFQRKYQFEQDISRALLEKTGSGVVTGGTQADVDAYYKQKAEELGMQDRFETDYIAVRERSLVQAEQRKQQEQARVERYQSRLNEMKRQYEFDMETDRILMADPKNPPSQEYLDAREQFIPKMQQNLKNYESLNPEKKKEDEENYAKGYIPNFAIDPMAITEAKLREKREAGSDSIPTFAMYNGKPMVYDARTQTPASAIRDHAFEGGYEGVVKRQFGTEMSQKNIVANMAVKPKPNISNTSMANNPVFNINFNPQTTFSSQKNAQVPNFANITKKYDAMISDMRSSLQVVWDKYGYLENVTNTNIQQGKLNNAIPRTKRLVRSNQKV
jgi:TP901 family phage tail tape measure protein